MTEIKRYKVKDWKFRMLAVVYVPLSHHAFRFYALLCLRKCRIDSSWKIYRSTMYQNRTCTSLVLRTLFRLYYRNMFHFPKEQYCIYTLFRITIVKSNVPCSTFPLYSSIATFRNLARAERTLGSIPVFPRHTKPTLRPYLDDHACIYFNLGVLEWVNSTPIYRGTRYIGIQSPTRWYEHR